MVRERKRRGAKVGFRFGRDFDFGALGAVVFFAMGFQTGLASAVVGFLGPSGRRTPARVAPTLFVGVRGALVTRLGGTASTASNRIRFSAARMPSTICSKAWERRPKSSIALPSFGKTR